MMSGSVSSMTVSVAVSTVLIILSLSYGDRDLVVGLSGLGVLNSTFF